MEMSTYIEEKEGTTGGLTEEEKYLSYLFNISILKEFPKKNRPLLRTDGQEEIRTVEKKLLLHLYRHIYVKPLTISKSIDSYLVRFKPFLKTNSHGHNWLFIRLVGLFSVWV